MTMEFRLGDDDGVDGVGSNGACSASCEADLAPDAANSARVAQARMVTAGGFTGEPDFAQDAANSAWVAQARMATAGGCTVGQNVCGKSEFAASPVVADPLLAGMPGGAAEGIGPAGQRRFPR